MKPKLLLATVLAATSALTGCGTSGGAQRPAARPVLPPDARPARSAGLSPDELERGARLVAAKCVRCHGFYNPAAYTDAEWRTWMGKMSIKARLKPDQDEALRRYLEAFRIARP